MRPDTRSDVATTPPAVADARTKPRQRTTFVVGRIVSEHGEHICVVRNTSENGMGIEHSGDIREGQSVTIETRSLLPTRAVVRWSSATNAGLEFLELPRPASAQQRRVDATGIQLRSPRFAFVTAARLLIDDMTVDVQTINIALGGFRLHGVPAGLPATVASVELGARGGTLRGRLRWNADGETGFQFATPLTSRELAALVSALTGNMQ